MLFLTTLSDATIMQRSVAEEWSGTMVECYWQGETDVLGEKIYPSATPSITNWTRAVWNLALVFAATGRLLTAWGTARLVSKECRSRWLRGLSRGSAAARLLGLRVRIPSRDMDVSYECCVLSGTGLCVGLITRPEESYRVWCVQWVWSRSPVRVG